MHVLKGNKFKMKTIRTIFILGIFLLSSCTPGTYFEIENITIEPLRISYKINENFLWEGLIGEEEKIIPPGEYVNLNFRILSIASEISKNGLKEETVKSIFDFFEVYNSKGDLIMSLNAISRNDLVIKHRFFTSISYVLQLAKTNATIDE